MTDFAVHCFFIWSQRRKHSSLSYNSRNNIAKMCQVIFIYRVITDFLSVNDAVYVVQW